MTELDIEGALKELQEKTVSDIEHATAMKWAARAVASYQLSTSEQDPGKSLDLLRNGDTFSSEALEHAANVKDHGALVSELQSILEDYEYYAKMALVGNAKGEVDEVSSKELTEDSVQDSEKTE